MDDLICKKCGRKLANKSSYKKHLNRKTSCVKTRNHVCIKCNKKFVRKYNLERHTSKFHSNLMNKLS